MHKRHCQQQRVSVAPSSLCRTRDGQNAHTTFDSCTQPLRSRTQCASPCAPSFAIHSHTSYRHHPAPPIHHLRSLTSLLPKFCPPCLAVARRMRAVPSSRSYALLLLRVLSFCRLCLWLRAPLPTTARGGMQLVDCLLVHRVGAGRSVSPRPLLLLRCSDTASALHLPTPATALFPTVR